MPSRWQAVDGLVRELGSLRAATLALEADRLDAAVLAEADRIIAEAVDAIEATLDRPEDATGLMTACEAIVQAQNSITVLRATRARSREIMARSQDLRREARLLFERITGGR